MAASVDKGKIAIIGSGLIGKSWAMLFASVGYKVQLYDVNEDQMAGALADIRKQLQNLEAEGTLKGVLSAEAQFNLISATSDLKTCLSGAFYVQECVFEALEAKQNVFKQLESALDALGAPDDEVILASSTSNIAPSLFTSELRRRSRVIVAHPANPPYYVRIVEVVPAPWTAPDVVDRTVALMEEIGQAPVLIRKEVIGFASNRIQYSIINECWRLVESGVISVKDVNTVMSEGIGMRYAFLGPLEAAHLNAKGMKEYIEKYAKGIYDTSMTFGPVPDLRTSPIRDQVVAELEKAVPMDTLEARQRWRDRGLRQLAKIKSQMRDEERDLVSNK